MHTLLTCTSGPCVWLTGGAAARAELGLADNYYDTSAGQRERMLKTTEKLDKTTDRISQGRAQLAETEVSVRWTTLYTVLLIARHRLPSFPVLPS